MNAKLLNLFEQYFKYDYSPIATEIKEELENIKKHDIDSIIDAKIKQQELDDSNEALKVVNLIKAKIEAGKFRVNVKSDYDEIIVSEIPFCNNLELVKHHLTMSLGKQYVYADIAGCFPAYGVSYYIRRVRNCLS